MRALIGFIFVCILVLATAPTARAVEAPVEPPASAASSVEKDVVRRGSSPATTQPGSTTSSLVRSTPGLDVKRVFYSLAIVLCLIVGLRYGGKLLFPGAQSFKASRAVQVVSRNVIAPKQQVLVLQVGRRVVVVGDTGQHLNTLCEITDPDEVASLLGQIRDAERDPVAKTFSSLFGRANSNYASSAAASDSVDDEDRLVQREDDVEVGLEDPALNTTRSELNGLMSKVRAMAEQFQKR